MYTNKEQIKPDISKHTHYCIFEKHLCKYAKNRGRVFECTAESDEIMPCAKEVTEAPSRKI